MRFGRGGVSLTAYTNKERVFLPARRLPLWRQAADRRIVRAHRFAIGSYVASRMRRRHLTIWFFLVATPVFFGDAQSSARKRTEGSVLTAGGRPYMRTETTSASCRGSGSPGGTKRKEEGRPQEGLEETTRRGPGPRARGGGFRPRFFAPTEAPKPPKGGPSGLRLWRKACMLRISASCAAKCRGPGQDTSGAPCAEKLRPGRELPLCCDQEPPLRDAATRASRTAHISGDGCPRSSASISAL